jgi:hypothetical protein
MHSNVGGGYAPGEQGRAKGLDEQLSQIPLLHLYKSARDHGVPLQPIHKLDPQIQPHYQLSPRVAERYDYYLKQVGASGCVEKQAAAHLYAYWRWRKLRATSQPGSYLQSLLIRPD